MKNDCNIVRDLMPLVIDGVASDESVQMVTEHAEECKDCEKIYQNLQGVLPEKPPQMEEKEFEQAVRKLKRKRLNRKTMIIAVSVLTTMIVLTIVGVLVDHMHSTYIEKDVNEYDVRLMRIKDTDEIVLLFSGVDGTGHGISFVECEDGFRMLLFSSTRKLHFPWEQTGHVCFMQNMNGCRLVEGHILEEYKETRMVVEIVLTDGEKERIIYRDGDPIPEGSEELKNYFYVCRNTSGAFYNATEEEKQELYDLRQSYFELIPEFK